MLRQIEELRPQRRYVPDLRRHREAQMRRWIGAAMDDQENVVKAA
jgi:hypothetical protein